MEKILFPVKINNKVSPTKFSNKFSIIDECGFRIYIWKMNLAWNSKKSFLPYSTQAIDLSSKSIAWFLHGAFLLSWNRLKYEWIDTVCCNYIKTTEKNFRLQIPGVRLWFPIGLSGFIWRWIQSSEIPNERVSNSFNF